MARARGGGRQKEGSPSMEKRGAFRRAHAPFSQAGQILARRPCAWPHLKYRLGSIRVRAPIRGTVRNRRQPEAHGPSRTRGCRKPTVKPRQVVERMGR